MPEGAIYDAERGYWTQEGAPLFIVDGIRPHTKKEDLETGEDMKGE